MQHFWTGGLETAGPGCYEAVAIARAVGDQWPNGASGPQKLAAARRLDDRPTAQAILPAFPIPRRVTRRRFRARARDVGTASPMTKPPTRRKLSIQLVDKQRLRVRRGSLSERDLISEGRNKPDQTGPLGAPVFNVPSCEPVIAIKMCMARAQLQGGAVVNEPILE